MGWDDDIGGQVSLCEYRFSLETVPRFLYTLASYGKRYWSPPPFVYGVELESSVCEVFSC